MRLPGGQGAGARCDVDRWFPAARVLASGEDRLVPTSSRLILRLSRLTFALSGREVGGLRQPARAVGGQRRTGGNRRRLLTVFFPCARDRRGPACTDLLPARHDLGAEVRPRRRQQHGGGELGRGARLMSSSYFEVGLLCAQCVLRAATVSHRFGGSAETLHLSYTVDSHFGPR